jgi:WD40 repeat protein
MRERQKHLQIRALIVSLSVALSSIAPAPCTGAPGPNKFTEDALSPLADAYGDPLPAGAIARLGTSRFRHGYAIFAARFAQNGRTLATVGAARSLCLWDWATGKPILELGESGQGSRAVAYSPDGTLIAFEDTQNEIAGRLSLVDVATGKELRQLQGHADFIQALAFSPDGRRLASASSDRTVGLWEVATGKMLHQLQGHARWSKVQAVAFSPDGKYLASGGFDRVVILWDANTGNQFAKLTGHQDAILSLDFSPDNKVLASASADGTIRLWNFQKQEMPRVLDVCPRGVRCLAFGFDGQLFSGDGEGTITAWNLASGARLRSWPAHTNGVFSLDLAPDGRTLVSASFWESSPRFWDAATGKELRPFDGHRSMAYWLSFSPDGKFLLSAGHDHTLRRWDWTAGKEDVLYRWVQPDRGPVQISPNHEVVAVSQDSDDSVRAWNGVTGQSILRYSKPALRREVFTFSQDSKILASGGGERLIRLWDLKTGKEIHRFSCSKVIDSLAFSPDGKTLASSAAGTVSIWEVAHDKELRSFKSQEPILSLLFSPDGNLLASAAARPASHSRLAGRSRLWDVRSGEELSHFAADMASPYAVAFSPNGRYFAGSSEAMTAIREVATGLVLRRIANPSSGVVAVAFSSDGRLLAISAADSEILICDVTGQKDAGHLKPTPVDSNDFERAWRMLGDSNSENAFDALWALVAGGDKTVALLAKRLRPAQLPDIHYLRQLIADLDDDRFNVRQSAEQELARLGELARTALKQAAGKTTLQVDKALKELLSRIDDPAADAERLRVYRAIEILEQIATPSALRVLEDLARGAPEARLTREAKASLRRLIVRNAPGSS